ncbi:MAG: SufD family Fe-S cluster assembly protein [Eubacteriales bacterium]|nr:SufD family Fe-S cluster assembly protein [Eubacteriales bacterium]
MQINEMKQSLTYRWLKVNDAQVEWPFTDKRSYQATASKKEEGITVAAEFSDSDYGLSAEALSRHQEQENLCLEYHFYENGKTEYIQLHQSAAESQLVDRIDLQAEGGSDTTVVIDYTNEAGVEALRHSLLRVSARAGAVLRLIIVQRQTDTAQVYTQLALRLQEGAQVNTTYINIGAASTHLNYHVELLGKEAKHKVDTVYFLEEQQLFDTLYQVKHYGKRSVSDLQSKGVLKDRSKKLFRGVIDFRRGCTGASGNEEEFVTLLSPGAISRSVPILLCTEDDVNGNHASSVGQIEEDPLFYIMSRGIDEEEAKRLLVEAKLFPLLDAIPFDELREAVKAELHERLAAK